MVAQQRNDCGDRHLPANPDARGNDVHPEEEGRFGEAKHAVLPSNRNLLPPAAAHWCSLFIAIDSRAHTGFTDGTSQTLDLVFGCGCEPGGVLRHLLTSECNLPPCASPLQATSHLDWACLGLTDTFAKP